MDRFLFGFLPCFVLFRVCFSIVPRSGGEDGFKIVQDSPRAELVLIVQVAGHAQRDTPSKSIGETGPEFLVIPNTHLFRFAGGLLETGH